MMSKLVEDLKNEHKFLAGKLTEIKEKGLVNEEARKVLFDCKEALLAHLAKEDNELYSVLNKAAETDASVKSTVDTFTDDMKRVSKTALDFFTKYEREPENEEFLRDIARLLASLGNRISKEEHILYPLYEKVVEQ